MDEVLSARATRSAVVERFFDELSDGELEGVCRAKPSPEYPDEPYLVGRCVWTVLREDSNTAATPNATSPRSEH